MDKLTPTRSPRTGSARKKPESEAPVLPYNLKRELEEIHKNSGMEIDMAAPIEELEEICNRANRPPGVWRNRWQ